MKEVSGPSSDEPLPGRRFKIGCCYINELGDVLLLAGFFEGLLAMRSLMSASRYFVSPSRPLRLAKEEDMGRVNYMPAPAPAPTEGFYRKGKVLSAIIDALLMHGGMTITGIAREVQRRASSACAGKDVRANIRARIHWLQRRGLKLYRDDAGRVQIRQE